MRKISIRNLKVAMAKEELNFKELSKKSNISENSLSRLANGKTINPKLDTVITIAKALNTTVDELLED